MSINNWITNQVFPNLHNGYYLEVVKNDNRVKGNNYLPFTQLNWQINTNYIIPKLIVNNHKSIKHYYNELKTVKSFEKFLKKINTPNNFINCFVSHTSRINNLFNNLDLMKYRFGVIILKCSNNINHRIYIYVVFNNLI